MRIATNSTATSIKRHLGNNSKGFVTSTDRLSSGNQYTSTSESGVGIYISNKMTAGTRSLKAASKNIQDGQSFLQTAEGVLSDVNNLLIRLKELFVQGASGTYGDKERSMIEKEVKELKSEIVRIMYSTQLNGVYFLDGSTPSMTLQVGRDADPTTGILEIDLTTFHLDLEKLGIIDISLGTQKDAQNGLERINQAVEYMGRVYADVASMSSRLRIVADENNTSNLSLNQARTKWKDADFAEEAAENAKTKLMTDASTSMLAQASRLPSTALKLI